MIDQDLVKKNLFGRDGFTWWVGQIPASKVWKMNTPGTKVKSNEDIEGFDYRYKVRIMGYHTANVNDLKDEELPWAGVMFPITAGVSGGAIDTPQIMQGNFVYGFFLDGSDAQVPVIMGIIGYNQYTKVLKNIPDTPFKPFSAYEPTSNKNSEFINTDGVGGKKEVKDDTVAELKNPYVSPKDRGGQGGNDPNGPDVNSDGIIGDSTSAAEQIKSGADVEQERNRSKPKTLPTTSRCDAAPTSAIQTKMKSMLNETQLLKKSLKDWETRVSLQVDNIEDEIKKVTDKYVKEITGDVKRIMDGIQRNVKKKVNDALKQTYHLSLPSVRGKIAKEIAKANSSMGCLFKNLAGNLFNMVGGFMKDILNRYINAPLCAVENFVGGLLGNLTGLLDVGIGSILGPIKGLISGLGGALDIGGDLMGFATDALSILDCKPDPKCSDVKEWSAGGGPVSIATLDVASIINKAKGVSSLLKNSVSQITGVVDDISNIGDQIGGAVDGIKNLASDAINDCNVGALFCGPPTISFNGGGGSGAAGNAIISAGSAILGIDVILPGTGYVTPPKVVFNDDCGKGKGASGKAVINDKGEVVQVIMEQTGTGYLSVPDGSQGGDGTTYANPDETIIKRADGTYDDAPYKPGIVVEVCPGDQITKPGGIKQTIGGNDCVTITTEPQGDQVVPRGEDPTLDDGSYPVILEIDEIAISNPGIGYDAEDKVVIEPSNGCEFKLKVDELGSVTGVDVIKGCSGFLEEPEIYIQSNSGYNARLLPVFNVVKEGIDAGIITDPTGTPVIQVVDCVGKVSHLGRS